MGGELMCRIMRSTELTLLCLLILGGYKGAEARNSRQLTIRHGNLEVPNLLARLPHRYTWPDHQAKGNTETKINQKARIKITPTKRLSTPYKSYHKHKTHNKPTIEKINWAQYSRMRNLQHINQSPNHSHKTAFSPSIHVMDGDNQMITRVNGVGLVIKNKKGNMERGNNRQIVNQMRGNTVRGTENDNWQKPKKTPWQSYNYQQQEVLSDSVHHRPQQVDDDKLNRVDKGQVIDKSITRKNNGVIMNNIRGYNYNNKNQHQQVLQGYQRWRSTPGPGQRLVTWLPKLGGKTTVY